MQVPSNDIVSEARYFNWWVLLRYAMRIRIFLVSKLKSTCFFVNFIAFRFTMISCIWSLRSWWSVCFIHFWICFWMPTLNSMLSLFNFSLHNLMCSSNQLISFKSLSHLSELRRRVIQVQQLWRLGVSVEWSVILVQTTVYILNLR